MIEAEEQMLNPKRRTTYVSGLCLPIEALYGMDERESKREYARG